MKKNAFLLGCVCLAACIGTAGRFAIAAGQADQILAATGVKGGLIVHLGCGDPSTGSGQAGKLTATLRANDSYLVHGLDADAANVAAAREHIRSLGLYGPVSADTFDGKHLPYTDNLVNLVVAEDLGAVPMTEIMRVLAPNGVAYIKQGGAWSKTVKPRPKDIDDWTHYLHDASNNAVAHDTVVGPPRHYQWIAGPKWARSHDHLSSTSAVVSAGGRIFYIIDEGPTASVAIQPKWFLVARDAFNGVLLWKRPVGPWEGHLRSFRSGPSALARRLVAVGDRVYVTLGYGKAVTALDAATGKTLRTYGQTRNALEIIHHEGVLFVVVGDRPPDNTGGAATPNKPAKLWYWWPIYDENPPRTHIVAIKAEAGEMLWKKADADAARLMPTTLAAAGKRVFFQGPEHVFALDAASGRQLWRAPRRVSRRRPSWSAPTLVVYGDVVLSGDRASAPAGAATESGKAGRWIVDSQGGIAPPGQIIAFSAEAGKKLWESECRESYNSPPDVLVAGGVVWSGKLVKSKDPGITTGRDVRSGQVTRRRPKDQAQFRIGMGHHRCYRNKATVKYLVLGRDGIEFIDVATGKGQAHPWVRGACQYGVMPCNGLVYAPPHSCACHIESKLSSFNALAPAARARPAGAAGPRLEKGPAYAQVSALTGSTSSGRPSGNRQDWPTYRHDPGRSGKASTTVPAELTRGWRADLGGLRRAQSSRKLSSVVVADGKLFVASVDAHTVHALVAGSGKPVWRYTAGGRVDSPPTIWQGLALFGCADGWVYCLRSADGVLAWRFRAAPHERHIVSYGQVESAWPVHGSVLVQQGIVYAVAGRSSHLDGGMYLYRLNARTGRKLSETRVTAGALPDVLSSDGTSVFMRHKRFSKNGVEQKTPVAHLYSPAGFLDGDWWHRTYWLVGTAMGSGWGRWPNSGLQAPAGRLLVVDGADVYGFGRLNQYHRNGTHIGLGGTRYLLYAYARGPKPVKPSAGRTKAPKKPKSPRQRRRTPAAPPKVTARWSLRTGVMARAMVLSAKTLFVAGPPDVLGKTPPGTTYPYYIRSPKALQEQQAAFSGHKGAVLWVVSAADGKKLAEYRLDSPPVFDGMAAAGGRLFLATRAGEVLCFTGAKQ